MQVTLMQCDVCGARTPETNGREAWSLLGASPRPKDWKSIYLDDGARDICPECLPRITAFFKTVTLDNA